MSFPERLVRYDRNSGRKVKRKERLGPVYRTVYHSAYGGSDMQCAWVVLLDCIEILVVSDVRGFSSRVGGPVTAEVEF